MKETRKERIKLWANFLNNLAVVTFAFGFLGLVLSVISGIPSLWVGAIGAAAGFTAGLVLHFYALRSLGKLDE